MPIISDRSPHVQKGLQKGLHTAVIQGWAV